MLTISSKTIAQDVLDVRKKSVDISDRVGVNATELDKENKLPQVLLKRFKLFDLCVNKTVLI